MIEAACPWPWCRLVWRYNLITWPTLTILYNWYWY